VEREKKNLDAIKRFWDLEGPELLHTVRSRFKGNDDVFNLVSNLEMNFCMLDDDDEATNSGF
jgi:hypothetical protein